MMKRDSAWLWVFRTAVGLILLSGLLFCLGFSTNYWSNDNNKKFGLWEKCSSGQCVALDSDQPAYFVATQAFQTMALIMYTLSPIVHFFVFLGNDQKSDGIKSRIFDLGYSTGAVFHLCSILIFGLKMPNPETFSWSFNMSAASVGLACVGVAMVIVSRKKALRNFGLFPSKDRGRKNRRVGSVPTSSDGGSSIGTPKCNTPVRHERAFGPASRSPHHAGHQNNWQSPSFISPALPSTSYIHTPAAPQTQSYPHGEARPYEYNTHHGATSLAPIRGVVPSAPPLTDLPTYDEAVSYR